MESEWISNEEKALVEQLRRLVWDELPPAEHQKSEEDQTVFLLKWLRGRDLDLNKAHQMLLNALKWREENQVDKTLSIPRDPYLVQEYRYAYASGVDNLGQPVILSPMSTWDLRRMINAEKTEGFDHHIRHAFEDWMKTIQEVNEKRKPGTPPITQFTIICDLTGYPYGQLFSIGAMKKWIKVMEVYAQYYPECLSHGILINCPSFFQIFLTMMRGILPKRTMDKIKLYPTMEEWKKVVDTFVDPSFLPEQFGGTSKINPLNSDSDKETVVKGA